MNNKFINVEVFFNDDDRLQVSYQELNKHITWSLYIQQDNQSINNFFDDLAKQKLLKCYEKENDCILHVQNRKNTNYRIMLKDYNKLLNIIKCDQINKKMYQYWFRKAIKETQKKLNLKLKQVFTIIPPKAIIAGSIVTASIIIPTIPNNNNDNNELNNLIPSNIAEEVYITDIPKEEDKIIINEEELNVSKQNDNEIEELIIEEDNLSDIEEDNLSEISADNHTINFSELANFTSPMEYINFASNLYGVDIETAKALLEDKIGNMDNYINNSNDAELKNLYELKSIGIINGDLDVMGTFVIIKNYAIDNLNIDNQEPIISNKTASEKEKDMIDIARYVYGIEDTNILNTIIATHRVETGHGNSAYALKLNNLGGNMNANPSQEQIERFIRIIEPVEINIEKNPIPNIYKTVEIGEESMIRNFLNIYSKCLHDECLSTNNVVEFLSKKYCTHTPEAWAKTVNEILNEGTVQEDVASYIDNHDKKL